MIDKVDIANLDSSFCTSPLPGVYYISDFYKVYNSTRTNSSIDKKVREREMERERRR